MLIVIMVVHYYGTWRSITMDLEAWMDQAGNLTSMIGFTSMIVSLDMYLIYFYRGLFVLSFCRPWVWSVCLSYLSVGLGCSTCFPGCPCFLHGVLSWFPAIYSRHHHSFWGHFHEWTVILNGPSSRMWELVSLWHKGRTSVTCTIKINSDFWPWFTQVVKIHPDVLPNCSVHMGIHFHYYVYVC